MQAAAPPGFKVHLDFTMYGDRGGDKFLQLLLELCQFPVVGAFEDPLWENDLQGYEELRKAIPRPIGLHHFPLGATTDLTQHRPADFYMLGHQTMGACVEKAGLMAAIGAEFLMQNAGGIIARAIVSHMSAVFEKATRAAVTGGEIFRDDPVKPCSFADVHAGFVRVPDEPGLGVELDHEKLAAATRPRCAVARPWIARSVLRGGAGHVTRMWHLVDGASEAGVTLSRPSQPPFGSNTLVLGFAMPIETEYWDDDGSKEWREMRARIEAEGAVMRKEPAPRL